MCISFFFINNKELRIDNILLLIILIFFKNYIAFLKINI